MHFGFRTAAITIAYAVLDKPDPLRSAATIVRGYHTTNPLTDDELTVLWVLVQMRLCASVCIAAEQNQHRPNDPAVHAARKGMLIPPFYLQPALSDGKNTSRNCWDGNRWSRGCEATARPW